MSSFPVKCFKCIQSIETVNKPNEDHSILIVNEFLFKLPAKQIDYNDKTVECSRSVVIFNLNVVYLHALRQAIHLIFIVKAICIFQGKLSADNKLQIVLVPCHLCHANYLRSKAVELLFFLASWFSFFDKFLIAMQQEKIPHGLLYNRLTSPHLWFVLSNVIDCFFINFPAKGGLLFRTINIDTCKSESYYYEQHIQIT